VGRWPVLGRAADGEVVSEVVAGEQQQ